MNTQPDITFILVTYNSEQVIGACLDLLPRDRRIIVIDNGSSDKSAAIAANYANVNVVCGRNIGYGKAANLGFSMTTTPYAVLINPDVKIAPGMIDCMLTTIKTHPDIGILGARMFHWENGQKHYQRQYEFNSEGLCEVPWIVGALMMFRMEALKKAGGFDENIFLFFEETDLCDRFLEAGYRLAVCEQAEAEHAWGRSTTQSLRVTKIRAWHAAWSRAYYYKKHYGFAKSLRKSASKALKNTIHLLKNLLLMRKTKLIVNAYELMGLGAFFLGLKAYRPNGAAWITTQAAPQARISQA